MKKLEDQYLVIKKEDVDATALTCLLNHLKHNHIPVVEALVCESSWSVNRQVRNLILFGTVDGMDLHSMRELESETITVEQVGELRRSVTERFYRVQPENRLETKIEVKGDVDAAMLEAALAAAPTYKAPHLPCMGGPFNWKCTRERGHIGPCALVEAEPMPRVEQPKPQEATARLSDSAMYAYYLKNNNVPAMLEIEEKHLLVGYPPEQVSIGLKAIEEGKDPIYAINCHIEKDASVPRPVEVPAIQTPGPWPVAPQPAVDDPAMQCQYSGYPCLSERALGSAYCPAHTQPPAPPPPPAAPATEWAKPVALPCLVPGCESFRDLGSPYYCREHAQTTPEPAAPVEVCEEAPQMPEAQTPVIHKSWCREKCSAFNCACQEQDEDPALVGVYAAADVEPESKRGFCEIEGCEAERRLGSRYCRQHTKPKKV